MNLDNKLWLIWLNKRFQVSAQASVRVMLVLISLYMEIIMPGKETEEKFNFMHRIFKISSFLGYI